MSSPLHMWVTHKSDGTEVTYLIYGKNLTHPTFQKSTKFHKFYSFFEIKFFFFNSYLLNTVKEAFLPP